MKEVKISDFHESLKKFKINVQEENIKILQEELNNQCSNKRLKTYHSQKRVKTRNIFIIARKKSHNKQGEKSIIRVNSSNKVQVSSTLSNEMITKDLFSRFDEFQRRQRKELKEFQKVQNHIRKILKIPPLLFTDLKTVKSDSKRSLFNSSSKKYLFIKKDDNDLSLNKNKTRFNTRYSNPNINLDLQLEKTKNEFPVLLSYNFKNKINKNKCKTKTKIKHCIQISPSKSNIKLTQNQKIKTCMKDIDKIFIEKGTAIRKKYVHRIIL